MEKISFEQIVDRYKLQPHPEGGYFTESFRDQRTIMASALPQSFNGHRNYSTAIIFLLAEGQKSHLHRLKQAELWHFYLGGPLRLVLISPAGEFREIILGPDILKGQHLQYPVEAGTWFGATPLPGAGYSLVGCTVAPGFDFADFELAESFKLQKEFPALYGIITEFS